MSNDKDVLDWEWGKQFLSANAEDKSIDMA
jgi:hypothetical protein